VTDARGRFVLDGLDAKEVTHVVASFAAGGVASQCVMPVRLEASKACEVVVKLRAPRRLRGVVLTPEGAPARDARVVLRSPLTFRSCLTDAAGRFELDDPNREEGGWLHAVAFENGFFAAASVSSDSLDPRETDVYLSPCQGSVKLRVVDDATGEPVRRCTFAVAYPACLFGGLGAVPVDNAAEIAPGVYRFPFGPTAGDTAGILVSAPGYLTHHGPSLSSDGQARLPEVEVRLVKAETAFRRE
jgi:hypothetical protein